MNANRWKCVCGQEHHSEKYSEELAEIIAKRGRMVRVAVGGRTWMVDRIYIAFHGLKAVELPFLGFEEVTDTQ